MVENRFTLIWRRAKVIRRTRVKREVDQSEDFNVGTATFSNSERKKTTVWRVHRTKPSSAAREDRDVEESPGETKSRQRFL